VFAKARSPAQAFKFRGRIEGNVLLLGDSVRGFGLQFTMTPDGKLRGERFVRGNQAGKIILSKME
jgi:hypothetical protein